VIALTDDETVAQRAADAMAGAATGLDLPGRSLVVRPSTAAAHVAETVPA
jgi:hypothetical protein